MKKNNKNIINHIMNTPNSEENKSKSGSISSESEKKLMRKKNIRIYISKNANKLYFFKK